jgi:hypothetical protein
MALCAGARDDEERCLRIARWIAENVTNKDAAGRGIEATFSERRGYCGARARLFVEMAKSVGVASRVFSIFDPGLRHTVVQARINGTWRFIDPMYGVVFRSRGALLGFDEMRADPDAAVAGMEILGGSADTYLNAAGNEAPLDLERKVRSLYAATKLSQVRTFGFLHDPSPLSFYAHASLSPDALPCGIAPTSDAKAFAKSCARLFHCHMPNFIGATNQKVRLVWELCNAVPGRTYELSFDTLGVQGKGIAMSAVCTGGVVLSGARREYASGAAPDRWTITFMTTAASARLAISPADETAWGDALSLSAVALSEAATGQAANAAPPRSPGQWQLLEFLELGSTLTRSLRDGSFYPYRKRPGNWTWLDQGLAAIYAFRITGDVRFLEWMAGIARELSKYRDCETGAVDDYRRRRYRSWGARVKCASDGQVRWVNEVCTGASMALPIALMAWEAGRHADTRPALRAELADHVQICKDVAAEFAEDLVRTDDGRGAYFVMPHDGNPEPLAHAAPYAALLCVLHRITSEPDYLETAALLERYFRSSTSAEEDGTRSWPYRPTPARMHGAGEPFFKARVTLLFPLVAHSLGLLFTSDDMALLARTVDQAVVRDDGFLYATVSRKAAQRVGTKAIERYAAKNRLGSFRKVLSLYPFAAWVPSLATKLEQLTQTYPEIFGTSNFTPQEAPDVYALRLDVRKAIFPPGDISSFPTPRASAAPRA